LDLGEVTLRHADGDALNLELSSIARLVVESLVVEGGVRLYRTVIGDLITDSQPPAPLFATGWEVLDLHGPLREDVSAAMCWLDTNPATTDPKEKTSTQPWHALAAVYERNGDPGSARKLRYAAAKKLTSQSAGLTKIAGWLYDALVGHGYYPVRAFGWLVAVVLAGWLLVSAAGEDIVPTNMKDATTAVHDREVATKAAIQTDPVTARTPCELYPTYPCHDAFTFAVNAVAPASVSTSNTYWTVKPGATWLTTAIAALRLFGWVLAALLLAGVTGLLRKT
jgi:hypothetical protein